MTNPFIGEIRIFAGNFAPQGWAFCDGSLLDIATNDALFNLIGTTYGGDGVNTFALPDLRGRIPFHSGVDPIGTASGQETVTLQTSQLPQHTHIAQASANAATATTPAGNTWASWGDAQYVDVVPDQPMDPAAIGPAGGAQPHENRPPYLGLSFIISLFGIFPTIA